MTSPTLGFWGGQGRVGANFFEALADLDAGGYKCYWRLQVLSVRGRSFGVASVLLLAISALSACDPVPQNAPLSLSSAPNGVTISICSDEDLHDFFVQFRPSASGDWITVFEASGGPVSTVDTVHPDSSLVVSRSEPFEAVGSSYVYVLFSDAPDSASLVYEAEFRIPDGGLAPSKWIHSDGSVDGVACR